MGELRLLGTKVPRSDSPEKRGGPWAPPPRCVFLKAVLLCVWYLVRVWDSCLGNLKRSGALGLLSCILSPLSFGPVRFLAFSVLGSQGGGASSLRLLFLGRRGSGGLTDDRIYELCFCYFCVLFLSTTSVALAGCWARTSSCRLSSRRCFPQAISSGFVFFFFLFCV